jgi:hypothetical protein
LFDEMNRIRIDSFKFCIKIFYFCDFRKSHIIEDRVILKC